MSDQYVTTRNVSCSRDRKIIRVVRTTQYYSRARELTTDNNLRWATVPSCQNIQPGALFDLKGTAWIREPFVFSIRMPRRSASPARTILGQSRRSYRKMAVGECMRWPTDRRCGWSSRTDRWLGASPTAKANSIASCFPVAYEPSRWARTVRGPSSFTPMDVSTRGISRRWGEDG